MTADDQLYGWKEIARYLGVERRSAQRYERRGLPVRRMDPVGGGVYAVKAEVQAWRDGRAASATSADPPLAECHAMILLPDGLPAGRYVLSIVLTEHATQGRD